MEMCRYPISMVPDLSFTRTVSPTARWRAAMLEEESSSSERQEEAEVTCCWPWFRSTAKHLSGSEGWRVTCRVEGPRLRRLR